MDVGNLISGSSTFFKSSLFTGRTDVEAETSILWPPDANSWLIWKDPDAGKDWRQEKKGTAEDKIVVWHHQLNGHKFEWTLGVGDGQGGLACYDSWGRKELNMIEWLNWTELTRRTFVSKVMSLLFNMLSRLVINFLPRSKCLLISWLQVTICSDFGAHKDKVWHCFHSFPI